MALVGQPNVGKSSLFTRLTGVGVISSNYPGTTVEFDEGVVTRNGKTVSVHDLPGTYSMSGNSDDEKVVLRDLWEGRNDSVVLVADATNLVSSLVLCFEALELGLPTIIALTKMDEAKKKYRIDVDALSGILGVPVVPVSSKTSEGVDALADAVCDGRARASGFRVEYMPDVEKALVALEDGLPDNLKFNKRGVAVKLLEGSEPFDEMVTSDLRHTVGVMKKLYRDNTGQGLGVSIATSKYAEAESIVADVVSESDTKPSLADRISDVMITPVTGIPILLAVCLLILTTIIYVGSFLDEVVSSVYGAVVGTAIIDLGGDSEFWTAVLTGIDGSIQAIMSLVIPYIMVFYIILGILEDSGYLTRAVVLLDKTMHHFGLHGGSFIPIIVGLGCNVPAIMAVRTVQSRREKVILSSMIVMAVPCSAQMAIIMGATGQYSGIVYAFGILVMLVCLAVVTGHAPQPLGVHALGGGHLRHDGGALGLALVLRELLLGALRALGGVREPLGVGLGRVLELREPLRRLAVLLRALLPLAGLGEQLVVVLAAHRLRLRLVGLLRGRRRRGRRLRALGVIGHKAPFRRRAAPVLTPCGVAA